MVTVGGPSYGVVVNSCGCDRDCDRDCRSLVMDFVVTLVVLVLIFVIHVTTTDLYLCKTMSFSSLLSSPLFKYIVVMGGNGVEWSRA